MPGCITITETARHGDLKVGDVKIQTEIRKKRMIRRDMEGKILLSLCGCVCVCVCTTSQISNNFSIVVLIAQKFKIYAVPGSHDHKK